MHATNSGSDNDDDDDDDDDDATDADADDKNSILHYDSSRRASVVCLAITVHYDSWTLTACERHTIRQ